ncbi:MAG: M10 family metallopeptidase C-terminal domain-containing protein [Alphaproteobacteria bacterium]|nr:M10 family metallopeptidase C-terminal domain-containing protein [Alphaproteobacteria bacterium]
MCILCSTAGRFLAEDPTPQFSGGAPGAGGPGAGGPGGSATDALLGITQQSTARWNFSAAVGTPVSAPGGIGQAAAVTFGFLASAPGEWNVSNFQPLTNTQQAGMRNALQALADVACITLTETAGASADIRIGRADLSGIGGFAYFPGFNYSSSGGMIRSVTLTAQGGDIVLANNATNLDMSPGSFGYLTALHEAGHAIGLKHPFEGPTTLSGPENTTRYTLMAYDAPANAGIVTVSGSSTSYSWTASSIAPRTPMLYDIWAAQQLYGANTETRAGDSVYSWGVSEAFFMTIWDGGGIDVIDASNQLLPNRIDLNAGAFSSIGMRLTEADRRMGIPAFATATATPSYDGQNNLAIAYGALIERALGGSAADSITGNALDNTLSGGAGDDVLNGSAGNDVLQGGAGHDQFVIDSAGDAITEAADEGTDTAWVNAAGAPVIGPHVEIIRLFGAGAAVQAGQTGADIVANAALSSTLSGGDGADVLWGSALANTLSGGTGDDIIRAQGGGGRFAGGPGNDNIVVDALATTIIENAAEGIDTAWVTVNGYTMAAGVEITRLAGSATQLTGSGDAEQIVANPLAASTLAGGTGDDVLWGSPFADDLAGGEGADTLRGQGGADTYRGGPGNDHFVVLDAGVIIIEEADSGYDTAWIGLAANTDFTLAGNVERANLSGAANRVTGNGLDNVLVGDAVASRLDGSAGSDTIFGSALADTLTGGAGNDVIYAGGGGDRLVFAGGWGLDQVAGFSTAAGGKLDFSGSGITFAQLVIQSAGGNTQVMQGGSLVLLFGVASLSAGDVIFG